MTQGKKGQKGLNRTVDVFANAFKNVIKETIEESNNTVAHVMASQEQRITTRMGDIEKNLKSEIAQSSAITNKNIQAQVSALRKEIRT